MSKIDEIREAFDEALEPFDGMIELAVKASPILVSSVLGTMLIGSCDVAKERLKEEGIRVVHGEKEYVMNLDDFDDFFENLRSIPDSDSPDANDSPDHSDSHRVSDSQGGYPGALSLPVSGLYDTPKSLGSILVGVAEGNYNTHGRVTKFYKGHSDPGNSNYNRGFCSWNHGSNSVADADRECIKSLAYRSADVYRLFKKAGLIPKDHKGNESIEHWLAYVNAVDLYNQSPRAGKSFPFRFKAQLGFVYKDKNGKPWKNQPSYYERITIARVEGFRANGKVGASGLERICARSSAYRNVLKGKRGDDWVWACIHKDQERRSKEIRQYLVNKGYL